ncbi:hypothetical protein DFH09DRAFT_1359796 [Mycena vulgaris]|nr:hypothetical protein DFH09DRAFT_1359796 [Mycena vulgaris]
MSPPIDEDVFSQILRHIPDSKTVYTVLLALPKSHLLFPAALRRLFQLPVHLDTYDVRAAASSSEVLDYLLRSDADTTSSQIVGSIRHLVIAAEHKKYSKPFPIPLEHNEGEEADDDEDTSEGEEDEEDSWPTPTRDPETDPEPDVDVAALHERLPHLFRKTRNLESLEYYNYPGLAISSESTSLLAAQDRLRNFTVDAATSRAADVRDLVDPEIWDIGPFLASLGRSITSLDLRHVCQTTLLALASHVDKLALFDALTTLKIDIREGIWDWHGGGSPQAGATGAYVFPSLKLPSVKCFELEVADLTLSSARTGPMDLVDCTLLTKLSLDIRDCLGWYWISTIKLFEALSPTDFVTLSHLEIHDTSPRNQSRLSWIDVDEGNFPADGDKFNGRYFFGFVQTFLGSILTGHLPNLTSLWVNERVLLPANPIEGDLGTTFEFLTVEELWQPEPPEIHSISKVQWRESLRAALGQLESLRVGFGDMDAAEIGLVLGDCDPAKLTQFGFQFKWRAYGHEEPISPTLRAHLARFPRLTDVHILFPRPETQLLGTPDPVVDALTTSDITAIFACNGSICRVGIGNSVVWERHYAPQVPGAAPGILLVSDGSCIPNPAVPRFYHAGYVPKDNLPIPWRHGEHEDNWTPTRPKRGPEIEQLRDLLRRILD